MPDEGFVWFLVKAVEDEETTKQPSSVQHVERKVSNTKARTGRTGDKMSDVDEKKSSIMRKS